jgi:hypothetical protein
MKTALAVCAQKLQKAKRDGFIRRVSWLDFEDRLRAVFLEIDNSGEDAIEFGKFYLSFSKKSSSDLDEPLRYRFNSLNDAQVFTGSRHLAVLLRPEDTESQNEDTESQKLQGVMERAAQISFSQEITGKITVMLYPYKSNLSNVNEDNFILRFREEPHNLTEKKIRKVLRVFFRYATATSVVSSGSLGDYAFRQWIELKDFRYRKIKIEHLTGRFLMVVLTAAGVWATLHAG